MLKRALNFIIAELIYNGHLQALGAAGIISISSLLFNVYPTPGLILASYLIFEIIYAFDRFKDIEVDAKTDKLRTLHLKRYLNKIPLLISLMLLLLIFLTLHFANLKTLITSLTILILGLLYPIYFKKLTQKIIAFKNFYVSAVHTFLIFYPAIYYSLQISMSVNLLVFLTYIFLEAMVSQVLLDTKDIKSDKQQKMLTIPVIIGNKKTLFYAQVLSTFLFVFIIIFNMYSQSDPLINIIAVSTFTLNIYASKQISNGKKLGYILHSGKFFLWLLISLAVNI